MSKTATEKMRERRDAVELAKLKAKAAAALARKRKEPK
jgi:hypothetical protein